MYKINDIFNRFLLAGDKFMPGMHLKQRGFTYIVCGQFTKNKERIQKFKETGYTKYIYRNELDKACFQHDITKDPKHDGYQKGRASMVYKFFDKKTSGSGIKSMPQNEQLAEEPHKLIIGKLKKEEHIHHSETIIGVLI